MSLIVNKSSQRLKSLTFPSLASLTLVACNGGTANRAPVAAADKLSDNYH